MKSLRKQGRELLDEAWRKYSSEPWKNSSSVNTERAAAPACSRSRASSDGLKSARIKPLEGEAFFSSAITATAIRSCAIRRSAVRNPRGVCPAAAASSAPRPESRRLPDMCADVGSDLRWERRWRVAATIESREAGMADDQLYGSRPIAVDPSRGRSRSGLSEGCWRSWKTAHCSVICAVDPPSGEML